MRTIVLALLSTLGAASGCAKAYPEPYLNERASAERNYTSGRYREAALAWQRASNSTPDASDRSEAVFRAAAAYQRAGDFEHATQLYRQLLEAKPAAERAPRAAYELALIEEKEGAELESKARLHWLITRYPRSAMAGRAFERLLRRIERLDGTEAALDFAKSIETSKDAPELSEQVGYELARLLAENGQLNEALAAYLELARDFPYPRGAYWDDALWHAAAIEREQGRPRKALEHLERMLKDAEPAHFQGSYTRSRYAEAQFRIAEIYRDDLDEQTEARRQFHKVFANYPTSLLRDDALWEEARLAHATGDRAAACEVMRLLTKELPDSRYAACSQRLCPEVATPDPKRPCHTYILRSLGRAASE